MKNLLKKTTAALLLALVLASNLFADPIGFTGSVNFGIMNGRNVALTVNAKGGQVTSYGVASRTGGVIFQTVAVPASGFEGGSVSLEYRPDQPDGQRLAVTIGDTAGNTAVTADLYDWQLLTSARFAATEHTAGVSLFGRPKTQVEILLFLRYSGDFMLVEFHPDFINTLTGMNLFFIDAMLVDGNLNRMRQITDTLNGVIQGYNDIRIDRTESARSAAYIRRLLIDHAEKWDNYIYTDYGTEIRYEIKDGKLAFTGFPSYLFMAVDDYTETVTVNEELNALIRQDIERVRAINPVIYRAAEQTAQWAAFFRMVKEQSPQNWESFITQIRGVTTPDIQIETPRYWIRN
jgi:hypothetical protein